jgi:tetratricopeptide (TPR) repeat protein
MSLSERPDRPFDRVPLALIALAAAAFYMLCATPSLGWRDGPELVVTADYLDIAHPSGFPTYNLIAKIATWLPLGSIGFRVSLLSALAGAACVLTLGLFVARLHGLGDPGARDDGSLALALAPLPFLALQQGFWAASVEVEVYTLNLLFLIALLYCAAGWFESGRSGLLYAGGLLYGLSCGNHGSMALYLPVLLLLTFWGGPVGPRALTGANHGPGRRLLILAGLFLVGLSVYALLLIRSRSLELPINLGDTTNLERFWDHVTDAKDRKVHGRMLFEPARALWRLKDHFRNLTSPLFWLGLPLVPVGLAHLWRRYRILPIALAVLVIINLAFFYYWIDGVSAFLPTITVYVLLVGLGLGRLGRLLASKGLPRRVPVLCAVLAVLAAASILGPKRLGERDSESGFISVELFWPDLTGVPPESIILQTGNWFSAVALQAVYSARPDVSVLHWPSLYEGRPIGPVVPQRFPMAAFPLGADGRPLSQYLPGYWSLFLDANIKAGKHVYIQYSENSNLLSPYLRPDPERRFLARLYTDDDAERRALDEGDYELLADRLLAYLASLGPDSDPPLARKAKAYLYYIIRPVAELVASHSRHELAERLMRGLFASLGGGPGGRLDIPFDAALNAQAFLATTLHQLKRYPEAIEAAERLIALDPATAHSYFLLASSQYAAGLREEAIASMEVAIDLAPYEPGYAVRQANLLAKLRSISAATSFLAERAALMRKAGLDDAAKALDDTAVCLSLPPEIVDSPRSPASLAIEALEPVKDSEVAP